MRLGHALRGEFRLDPDFLTVNHGSYGATPLVVLAAQARWRARMEAQPTRFMARQYPAAVREAAAALAGFLGASAEDVVFVDNATSGCNAVLRSLALGSGDEIVVLDHGYGAVTKAARFAAARAGGRVVTAHLPFPRGDEADIVEAVAAVLSPRTRLAVIDHITSASAMLLPVAAIAAASQSRGVPVLVDAAHSPGNIDLDVPALGADWVTGNAHKWLCAPKGSAFLWARRDRQPGLHPTAISHGFGGGFATEFDWTGTRDGSAWLSVPEALAFHERLGGAALRARNTALAAEAAAHLARRLGTEAIIGSCAMALVRLHLPEPVDDAAALALRSRLLDASTDAPVHALAGSAWLRVSAAAYNEMNDFDRLATILHEVLPI